MPNPGFNGKLPALFYVQYTYVLYISGTTSTIYRCICSRVNRVIGLDVMRRFRLFLGQCMTLSMNIVVGTVCCRAAAGPLFNSAALAKTLVVAPAIGNSSPTLNLTYS